MNYSSLQLSQSCLRKYKYVCIDKLKADAPESPDLHFGTAMHTGIQTLMEGDNLATALAVFNTYWNTLVTKDVQYGRHSWEKLQSLGEVFLTRFAERHFKHYTPFMVEQRLYGKIGRHDIEGTPDFIGEYKGIKSVVDFKTAGSEYPKEKVLINPQMYLYAYLAKQQLDYAAKQIVYQVFIKGETRIQTVVHEIQPGEIEDQVANAQMLIEDLENRTTFPKNTNSCMMGTIKCPYFNNCWGKNATG